MALTPQPLRRADDPVGYTAVVGPIVPRNWRTKSNKIGDLTDANPNEAKPRYTPAGAAPPTGPAGPSVTMSPRSRPRSLWLTRTVGRSKPITVPVTRATAPPSWGCRLPRMSAAAEAASAPTSPIRPRPTRPSPAPTLTTLTPATAAAGNATPQFGIKLTGTGFTPWSEVWMAGVPAPTNIYKYISPTEIRCQMSPASSFPGTITLAVKDHGVMTANQSFTWT